MSGLPNPVGLILPTTVSPTWNTPETIAISKSFGTQYLVTSLPSKKAYTLVSGFTLLATNCTFLERMMLITSLLITLSPTDVLSNLSVITVLVPVLLSVPVLNVSVAKSWKTVVNVDSS